MVERQMGGMFWELEVFLAFIHPSNTSHHDAAYLLCDIVKHTRLWNFLSLQLEAELCIFNAKLLGFPGGSVIKNSANAGDAGSVPDPGRSHMLLSIVACEPQLLNVCPRAWELQILKPGALKPVLHSKKATAVRSLCTATREQPPLTTTRENL